MNKRKRKKKSNLLFYIVFLIGFLVLMYPKISDFYYKYESTEEIKDFKTQKEMLNKEEIKKRIELAKGFNDTLNNVIPTDPYEEMKQSEGKKEYARMLELNEKIGHVIIPKIDEDIPIYAGTTEDVLQKGAGHLEGTSLPIGGESTHTVITAHSGLPKAKLFTDLNKLEQGDKFYINNIEQTLAYEVDQILTVEPHDFDELLIKKDKDYATLLTCTPYMVNTHRLLVRGHRIEYVENIDGQLIDSMKEKILLRYYIYISGMVFISILLIYLALKRKKKDDKKQKETK